MLLVAEPILQIERTTRFGHNLSIRDKIVRLEMAMKSTPGMLGEDPFPLKHWFTDGVYGREIFLPAGWIIIGKIHRHEHLNFIMTGDVSVLTEEGSWRIKAPHTMISAPGTKRVVYAHEDSTWTTIHANVSNTTDLREIEDFVIAKSYSELGLYDPVTTLLEGEKK